jgi:hypothetical protein
VVTDGIGFLTSQQQAIGEARMAGVLQKMLDGLINNLTEELKSNETV